MNGIHDLGGMHGFGPVVPEAHEPVFHHDWEKRVFGLVLTAMGSGRFNVDEFRHAIERIPPARYLASSYYERWLEALETLLREKGTLTSRAELPGGRPSDATWTNPESGAARVSSAVALRHNPKFKPRFRAGERVIACNSNSSGHTRAPRYVRGRRGVIRYDWGTFVFPDTHAHGAGACPQHCYAVEFTAREVWGAAYPARDRVLVDLWESYLERDAAAAKKAAPAARPEGRPPKDHDDER